MAEQLTRLATILEEAEHVHAVVSRKTGGADPDWALFYAWWLTRWSDLPEVLGSTPGLVDLTIELTRLDAAYRSGSKTDAWPVFYASQLLARDNAPAG